MNIIKQFKNGGLIRKMQTASGGPIKKPIKRLKDGYRYIPNEQNGGWDRISDNSMADVFATMEFTPNKTKVGSSITRKQSAPSKTYYSAYNPDDIIKGFNALTLGGLNNLSPTQWARRVYDTGKLLSGDMTWSGYTDSWINGNNGLVSLKFSEEHPYLSAGINLVGDAAALGGISNPNSIKESLARGKGLIDLSKYGIYDRFQGYRLYNKYLKNNIDNILNLLLDFRFDNGWIKTSDETGSLFLLPTTYTRSEVISSGPTSMRMGFTANPGGRLSRDLVSQGKEAISKLPTGTSISADAHGTSIPSRLSTRKGLNNITKTLLEGVEDSETTLSRMELLLGEEPGSFIRNPYDMSADAHRFFTLEAQKPGRQLVYAGRSGKWNNAAVSNPEIYLWQQAYESGTLSARDYVNNYNNWVKGFGGRPGHVDINGEPYFYHPTIFITHKQGGKMNILEFLKNGSGIHIKEKNKGKFTSYCGGKVTDECIRKAKASGNPTLVKRATFAANARKWKHKEGGIIVKAADGTKTNFFQKAGNFLNSDFGKGILSLGSLIFNGIKTGADVAKFSNSFDSATDATVKAMESKMKADSYLKGLLKAQQVIALKQQENPDIHFGEIDLRNMALNFSNEFYDSDTIDNYKALRAQEKLLSMRAIQGSASNNWLDAIGGIAGSFLNGKTKDSTEKSSGGTSYFGNTKNIGGNTYKTYDTPTYKTFDSYVSSNVFNTPGTIDSNGFLNTQLGKMDMNMNFVKKNPFNVNPFSTT